MNDEKFNERIFQAIALMIKQRQISDKSDKRLLRDTIRAIVKEITRV